MPEIAPIVGQPVAYGMALAMAVLFVFAVYIGRYPLTLAHEGAHMLALVATLQPIKDWEIQDNADGATSWKTEPGWLAFVLAAFVGYAGPPLLGLGGAALIADGNAWGVLILTLVLCILALVPARKWGLAFLVPLLIVLGVGWTLIDGTPDVRAAVAVGMVWYLLLGGLVMTFLHFGKSVDSGLLAKKTLIPRFVWSVIWVVIGLVCLIKGGALLLARS
ncbi:M50 family metallopeptidase [Pseudonocardia endophytica]|uniref:Peptidase M50B-like protein n=1 Tax=Pseudonocardia endophytica TaxID=401976 RepID=A0A4V2PJ79_PSEEN|nr:M50 family metallopeptidase [Pseudonocardia endophytica]TCK27446.1 peptidase M50B-like protein [Pseudonocardia endophytica]